MKTTGIIHVHTNLSRDGDMDVAALRNYCLERRISFACITDHVEDTTESTVDELVIDCDKHSDREFTAVPGLEIVLDESTHVLAIGLRKRPADLESSALIENLRSDAAILILAHPLAHENLSHRISDPKTNHPDGWFLSMLDGIEVWNASHDGGFFPNPSGLALYTRLVAEAPHLLAFGGSDLHRRDQQVRVRTVIEDRANILTALRSGGFLTKGRLWHFGSKATSEKHTDAALRTSYSAYTSAKALRDLVQRGGRR